MCGGCLPAVSLVPLLCVGHRDKPLFVVVGFRARYELSSEKGTISVAGKLHGREPPTEVLESLRERAAAAAATEQVAAGDGDGDGEGADVAPTDSPSRPASPAAESDNASASGEDDSKDNAGAGTNADSDASAGDASPAAADEDDAAEAAEAKSAPSAPLGASSGDGAEPSAGNLVAAPATPSSNSGDLVVPMSAGSQGAGNVSPSPSEGGAASQGEAKGEEGEGVTDVGDAAVDGVASPTAADAKADAPGSTDTSSVVLSAPHPPTGDPDSLVSYCARMRPGVP